MASNPLPTPPNDFVVFPPGMTDEQKATFRRNVAKSDAERAKADASK